MNPKHLTSAAVIAAGVVLSAMTSGLGVVNATALNPPPSAPAFHQDPGGPPPGIPAEKCWRYGRSGGGMNWLIARENPAPTIKTSVIASTVTIESA